MIGEALKRNSSTMMKIRATGTCEITIGETKITPDSVVLFAFALYLGARAGERVSRAALLRLFWPEVPEQAARHALRQLLYRLRKVGLQFEVDGEEMVVGTAGLDSDLHRISAPTWPGGADIADAEAAGSILPGYDAPISEGFREWLDGLRTSTSRQQRKALIRLIGQSRREARWADVERLARCCLASDPLNEEATLAVAEATAMGGGKASAVRILDDYLGELGPNAATIGLPARILRRRVSDRTFDSEGQSALDQAFVGRAAEVSRVCRQLDEAQNQRGGSVHILGDAGMGKTRLATEVRREAALKGFVTVNVRLHAADRLRPLSVVVDTVRALLDLPGALGCSPQTMSTLRLLTERAKDAKPEQGISAAAEVRQYQVREAVLDLLGAIADERALMIVIDDAQHVDAASLALLSDLVPWSAEKRILWLVASRPIGGLSGTPYLTGNNHSVVRLGALSQSSCARLIELALPRSPLDAQIEFGRESWKLAGGHPFFVRELVTAWATSGRTDDLPRSVSSAVADRISTLGRGALTIVQACSILGNFATATRISRLLDLNAREELNSWSELDALGIIGTSPAESTLTLHDIWREEVLRTIRTSTRRVLHLRAADLLGLEAGSARPVSLMWEIARHQGEAGEPQRSRMTLEQCAAYLMDVGLPEEAAATFQRAAEYCDGVADKLECSRSRIHALKAAGRNDDAAAETVRARSLTLQINPQHDVHDDLELIQLSASWDAERDINACLAHVTECVESRHASRRHRMRASVLLAMISDNVCRDDCLQTAALTADSIAANTTEFVREKTLVDLIFHTAMGDAASAVKHASEFVASHRTDGAGPELARALRFATFPHRIVGSFEAARLLLHESIELAERYRLATEAACNYDILATIALDLDEIDEAFRYGEQLERWTNRSDLRSPRNSLAILRARMFSKASKPTLALEQLSSAKLNYLDDPIPRQALTWLCAYVTAYAQLGDLDQLRPLVPEIESRLRRTLNRGRQDEFVRSFSCGLAALGRENEIAPFVRLYQSARRDGTPFPVDLLRASLPGPN